jgi:CubicO group peptidase (beta-lactamase class C family)
MRWLAGIALTAALGHCPALAAPPVDQDVVEGPLGQRLDEAMRKRAERGFSGVLLVAVKGKVVIAKGYGLADRDGRIPFTSSTVFDIGSITKQFTGAAIARLEMQGKLAPNDPLSKYFANAPADKADITLYQLLTHSAGLKGDFGGDYDVMSRDAIVERVMQSKLLYPPGTEHRYSNSGFSMLAAVVEQVSGQSYEAFLREQLFLPAGMEQTGYRLPLWRPESIAHGYRGKDKTGLVDDGTPLEKHWADDGPYWNLRGNGGLLSTVWDLYRWHLALSGDKVLSEPIKVRLYARKVKEDPEAKSWYSYGWSLSDTRRGTRVIEHNGGNGIFFADFVRYVDDDVVIIAASNRSEDAEGMYLDGIKSRVFAP